MHYEVRREYWKYETNVNIVSNVTDLHKIKYQGIRPAPGYPSQPDPTEMETYWRLLDVKNSTGMKLTENYAIFPAASVTGLYIAHPQSKYFQVGEITKEQVIDYSKRKNNDIKLTEKWLRSNLAYDPDKQDE